MEGIQRLCEPSIVHWNHGHIVKTKTTTIHLLAMVSNVFPHWIVPYAKHSATLARLALLYRVHPTPYSALCQYVHVVASSTTNIYHL
jgi:hypothetical protein